MATTRQAKELSYTVRFEPAEEGGYVVTVPSLPGIVTEGDTLKEARARAKEAIRGHLAALRKAGLPIPTEGRRTTLREQVRVASPTTGPSSRSSRKTALPFCARRVTTAPTASRASNGL